jgi:hypothetical protein
MAIRRSTALINGLAQGYGVRELLRDARVYVYTGSQPVDADTAPSGTLLGTFTLANGVYTGPTRATAVIGLSGSAGDIDSIYIGGSTFNLLSASVTTAKSGAVFNTDCVNIAANINARQNPFNITATASGETVILHMPYWWGAFANGLTVAVAGTTTTYAVNAGDADTFGASGGTATVGISAVNGLNFLETITDGTVSKEATAWQCTAVASGTAGWFRFVAGGSTVGVADTDVRFDGTSATSGGDMTISSTSMTSGAVYTISAGTITEPTAE